MRQFPRCLSRQNWTKMSNGLWYYYWILIWSCNKLLSAITLVRRINTASVVLNLMLNSIKWCWRTIFQSFFLLYFLGQQSVDKKSLTTNTLLHLSLVPVIPLPNLNQTRQKHGTSSHENKLCERVWLKFVSLWERWWVCSLLATFNTLQMQIC